LPLLTPFLEGFENRVDSQFSTIIIVLAIPLKVRAIFNNRKKKRT